MNPINILLPLLAPLLNPSEEWSPPFVSPEEIAACGRDRTDADRLEDPAEPGEAPDVYPVVDLEADAALVKYRNGKVKRTRYPRVNLAERKVVIGLHQAGVERSEARWGQTAHRVTCHRAIGPAGNRYRVHPLETRIVCTNRVDRAPWQCIGIETLGNYKGTPSGRHYKPERFGAGVLGPAQLEALREEIEDIIDEVAQLGGRVVGILPHRTTGVNSRGVPNRQICCGYEVWSGAGEWAGAELGLRVPGPDWSLGGLTIPDGWHGEYWPRCERFL